MDDLKDTTDTSCGEYKRVSKGDFARLVTAVVEPEKLKVKVGSLEVEATSPAAIGSKVTLNGIDFPVKGIKIWCDVQTDPVWKAEIEFYPGLHPKRIDQ